MFTLKAENRNMDLKPKQLRRKGIIPGVLYGKNLEQSVSIQIGKSEATRFLQSNSTGSKVELAIGDDKHLALFRDATYTPATGELEHLSFQTLLAGESVNSTIKVVLLNNEKIAAVVLQPHPEISYRALPSHLISTVEIDLDGMKAGDTIKISDLDIANNPDIEILDPLDTVVVSIVESSKAAAEASEEQETESEEQEAEA